MTYAFIFTIINIYGESAPVQTPIPLNLGISGCKITDNCRKTCMITIF